VSRNVGECVAILADRFAPWQIGTLRWIPILLMIGLLALGATRLWRRAPVTATFLGAYLLVTLVWPYDPWRFIWGIWPLVLLVAVAGTLSIVEWAPERRSMVIVRHVLRAAALFLGLGVARAEVVAYRDRAWSDPVRTATRLIAPAMRWISQNTRPHEVLVADAETLVYLFTDRPALPPAAFTAAEYLAPRSRAADAAALGDLVRRYPVRYVVTVVPSTIAAAHMLTATNASGITLREIDALDGGAVFEVVRP